MRRRWNGRNSPAKEPQIASRRGCKQDPFINPHPVFLEHYCNQIVSTEDRDTSCGLVVDAPVSSPTRCAGFQRDLPALLTRFRVELGHLEGPL
jgi:hypothetical protein